MGVPLDNRLESFYNGVKDFSHRDIAGLDQEMADELEKTKQKVEELKSSRESTQQIYEGACKKLGIEPTL